jgi:hypothetical protein
MNVLTPSITLMCGCTTWARPLALILFSLGISGLALIGEQVPAPMRQSPEGQAVLISSLAEDQLGVVRVRKVDLRPAAADWLITPTDQTVTLQVELADDEQSARLALGNGLISRSFYAGDNIACYSYRNLRNGAEFIRAIKPEMRVKLDGIWYDAGGLAGQPERSYLMEAWLEQMRVGTNAFRFDGLRTSRPVERYPWEPKFNAPDVPWPPKGLRVSMRYVPHEGADQRHKDLKLEVHYEMYEGIPVLAKSFTLENLSGKPVLVEAIETDVLALPQDQISNIHAESDYSFHLANHSPEDCHATGDHSKAINWDAPLHLAGRTTTEWRIDPEHDSWAHPTAIEDKLLGYTFRNLMVSRIPVGPAQLLMPGKIFQSHITFELLHDSSDRERRSLAVRRMYRTLCPQVNESLLNANTPSHDPAVIKKLIDQMAELGFESFTVAFWPGVSHDNLDPAYVGKWKDITDYAKARGIITSGYELMVASRGRGAAQDCIDPATGRPGSPFGQSLCLGTTWADEYFQRVWQFVELTGFMGIAVDGPYHGCPCAATNHAHHSGLADSQWVQWQRQKVMFEEQQRRGMSAGAPDWYIWNGQSSTSLGYREASANLPRELGLLLYRQYIYDGTWFKPPTMGGMSIGLIGTYTDDPRAMLEPLDQNLESYELNLVQLLASGCLAGLRANRLYDTERTKLMVRKWVDWYKRYRAILSSDIIHVRRPDGRDIDCMLHVNPQLEEKGLVIFFNPLNEPATRKFRLPLYYTGIAGSASIREQDAGQPQVYALDRDYTVELEIAVPPRGVNWFVIRDAKFTAEALATPNGPPAKSPQQQSRIPPPSDPVPDLATAVKWLEREAHRVIRAAAVPMKDGTLAFPPQVGIGYQAFWLRDYEYALEGALEAFSSEELAAACTVFITSIREDGAGVDCVKFDGTPIYMPGYGTMGREPVLDGPPFTVAVAWNTYCRTRERELPGEILDPLIKTMNWMPRNPANGLAHIKEPGERCSYGFTDSIPKSGDDLFCSLLFVQACRQLGDLLERGGRIAEAQKWRDEALRVEESVRAVLWADDFGLFRSTTRTSNSPHIWGSAFAVRLGVATEQQALRIARYFADHYDELVLHGQVRHMPGFMDWNGNRTEHNSGVYQSGAYWATPVGWFVYSLDLAAPELADRTVIEMVRHFQLHGACEWINREGQRVLPGYLASAALPLEGIRAMLARRAQKFPAPAGRDGRPEGE